MMTEAFALIVGHEDKASSRSGGTKNVLEAKYESLRVQNVERNGNIIYTYKDEKGNVVFGLYDCQTRQNERLYTFEKDLQVVSCSVNNERTLLAASFIQSTEEGRRNELQPGSKCLTLLVEISPVNYVKVLKAVDSCVWVQTVLRGEKVTVTHAGDDNMQVPAETVPRAPTP
nr:gamma-secretase-activating protein-like [Cavia porcellus]